MPTPSLLKRIPAYVKLGTGAIAAVGAIIGAYMGVESWAHALMQETKDELMQQQAVSDAKNDLIHNVIFQTGRAQYNESQLKIAELELAQIDDELAHKRATGQEIFPYEERTKQRLLDAIGHYTDELNDANAKIAEIGKMETKEQ